MPFASLGLSPELLRAVVESNFTVPTPVQKEAIPAILAGKDVWACAQTGSGKTAAFALPLLQNIQKAERDAPLRLHTLILVPTRELAAQVGESIVHFAGYLPRPVKVISVFGGVSINPQMVAPTLLSRLPVVCWI
jgi:ATP-dependent RNA helicase RhlE